MFRSEFINIVTDSGMVTLKEIRPLTMDKDRLVVSEFELLAFPNFDETKFAKMVAQKNGMQFIDLSHAKISAEILSLMQKKFVMKYRAIPIQKTPAKVVLASFDPTVKGEIQDLQRILKNSIEIVVCTITSWKKLYQNVRETIEEILETIEEVNPDSDVQQDIKEDDIGEEVISYVNKFLAESFIKKASDIHIENYENRFRIRLRIDGKLSEIATPPRHFVLPVISRLKILAQMDIAEKRKPQDGRIKLKVVGKPIDYRVSSLPTLFGEKMVLRLLDQSNLELDMTALGFEQKQLDVLQRNIHKPFGMCLVTGPTGSGKTTTLYSALAELNQPDVNISTAEDPVEFNLEGINQVNIKKDIGLTFAAALKAFLRQDPDIIMVGEIRDVEVGEIAIEAALTGHMVLSTLHTNDAPATITRILNMGVDAFLVAEALNVVVAQRLCRKICVDCKQIKKVPVEELVRVGFAPSTAAKIKVFEGKGCKTCNGAGYKGRVAIHEVLEVTQRVREIILEGGSTDEIKFQAIKEGMKTLRMSALTKVAQGIISIEEAVGNSAADSVPSGGKS